MAYRFLQRCADVMHATTVDEFSAQIISFVGELGFGTVAATVITDHSPTLTEFRSYTNAPLEYLDNFYDLAGAKLDPVSQHCKRSSAPIVWDQTTYVSCGAGTLWEHQAPFGYRNGICVAGHFPRGGHFMFGAQTNSKLPTNTLSFRRVVQDFQEFASYAQAAAFELTNARSFLAAKEMSLRQCELQALRKTMDGNASAEVATEMGISTKVVDLYIQNAMRKLGCSTRYEAVLRALQLGLLRRS